MQAVRAWWRRLPLTRGGSLLNLGIRLLLFPVFLLAEVFTLPQRVVEEEPVGYGLVQGELPDGTVYLGDVKLILSRFRNCWNASCTLFFQAILYVIVLEVLAALGLQHVLRTFKAELETAAATLTGEWYVTKMGKKYPSSASSGDIHHKLPGGHCLGQHSSLCPAAGSGMAAEVDCPCRASFLAACSKLAYESEPVLCDVLSHRWSVRLLMYLDIPANLHKGRDYVPDIICFAAASSTGVLITFTGAQPFNKIDRGTDIPSATSEYTDGFVRGLEQRAGTSSGRTVYQEVEALLLDQSNKEILLTGHSLGGALAVTFAQLLSVRNPQLAHAITGIFTYGAPRIGDEHFCNLLQQRFSGRLFRMVHGADLVCKLPHACQGTIFAHHCGQRFITSFLLPGRAHRVLKEEDEPKFLAQMEQLEDSYAYVYGFAKLLAAPFQAGISGFLPRLLTILMPGLSDHFPAEYQRALDKMLIPPSKYFSHLTHANGHTSAT